MKKKVIIATAIAGSPKIPPNDILEAIQYRSLDRNLFL